MACAMDKVTLRKPEMRGEEDCAADAGKEFVEIRIAGFGKGCYGA